MRVTQLTWQCLLASGLNAVPSRYRMSVGHNARSTVRTNHDILHEVDTSMITLPLLIRPSNFCTKAHR